MINQSGVNINTKRMTSLRHYLVLSVFMVGMLTWDCGTASFNPQIMVPGKRVLKAG